MGKYDRFERGMVLVPSEDPTPQRRITVERYEDGDLIAYPTGGGFQLRFPQERLEAFDFRQWSESDENSEGRYVAAKFFVDEAPAGGLEGFDTGDRWNGWACPLLTEDGFAAFRRWVAENCSYDENTEVRWMSEKDAYHFIDAEGEDYGPIETLWHDGQKLYKVDIGWCFDAQGLDGEWL